jgi:hypothetical protein
MTLDSMVLLDAAGRRRSPATIPGYLAGRAPRNKGSCLRRHEPFYAHLAGMPISAWDLLLGRADRVEKVGIVAGVRGCRGTREWCRGLGSVRGDRSGVWLGRARAV